MFTFSHRNPEMQLDKNHTAFAPADMQNEFLQGRGQTHEGVGYPTRFVISGPRGVHRLRR